MRFVQTCIAFFTIKHQMETMRSIWCQVASTTRFVQTCTASFYNQTWDWDKDINMMSICKHNAICANMQCLLFTIKPQTETRSSIWCQFASTMRCVQTCSAFFYNQASDRDKEINMMYEVKTLNNPSGNAWDGYRTCPKPYEPRSSPLFSNLP